MIDLHCHLLPGIDDGPASELEALAQAQRHVAEGVTQVVCTPHVTHGYRNTATDIADRVAALQSTLESAGIPLRIHAGAEVSLARALELDDTELTALHLGGGPYLLLEPPLGSDVPRMAQLVQGLQARGHRVLIAHPERCAAFHHDDALLAALVEGGALAQVTAGSLAGQFGRTVQKLARSMVDTNLIHVVASDAHDPDHRGPGLRAPLEEAGLEAFADWAGNAVPAAILSGDALPARPALPAATGRRRLFGRR